MVGRSWASNKDEIYVLEKGKHGVAGISGADGKGGETTERIEWARKESGWAEVEGELLRNGENFDSRRDSEEAERVGELSQEGKGEMAGSENGEDGGSAEREGREAGRRTREGRRRGTTREEGGREVTGRGGARSDETAEEGFADAKMRGNNEGTLESSDESSEERGDERSVAESRESEETKENGKKRRKGKKKRQRRCRELGVPCSSRMSKKDRVKQSLEALTLPIGGRILSPLDSPEIQKLLEPRGRVLLPGSGRSKCAVRFTPLQGFLEEAEKWHAELGRRIGGGDGREAEGADSGAEGEAEGGARVEAEGGAAGGKAAEEGSLRFPVRVVTGRVRTRRLVGDDDTALIVRAVNYGFAACEFSPFHSKPRHEKDHPIPSNHSAIQHRPELLALAAEMGGAMGGGEYDAVHVRRGDKLNPNMWPHLDRDTRPPASRLFLLSATLLPLYSWPLKKLPEVIAPGRTLLLDTHFSPPISLLSPLPHCS
ncbi:unnamed protein product [Closterium sp. Naga37s-1]|nr:unnamed protein product [Closterium sp. Naga37s-1]